MYLNYIYTTNLFLTLIRSKINQREVFFVSLDSLNFSGPIDEIFKP